MHLLSNDTLIETYLKAIDLNLERDFINLLRAEIRKRNINMARYERNLSAKAN